MDVTSWSARTVRSPSRLLLALLVGSLAACGGSGAEDVAAPGGSLPPAGSTAPDFRLTDVNPASPSAGASVGPTLRLASVSAWYFGHAT